MQPEPPEGATFIDAGECCHVLTAGLLGAKVDLAHFDVDGPRAIADARIEEAERRIIELEAIVETMRQLLAL